MSISITGLFALILLGIMCTITATVYCIGSKISRAGEEVLAAIFAGSLLGFMLLTFISIAETYSSNKFGTVVVENKNNCDKEIIVLKSRPFVDDYIGKYTIKPHDVIAIHHAKLIGEHSLDIKTSNFSKEVMK